MIGVFLLVIIKIGQRTAHVRERGRILLGDSTVARTFRYAAARAYPCVAAVYTIRTPSPGGQPKQLVFRLPAFFSFTSKSNVCESVPPCMLVRAFNLLTRQKRTHHVQ